MIGDTPELTNAGVESKPLLETLGYPGILDKVLGKSSLTNSIKKFQKDHGIAEDGVVGRITADLIQAEFRKACPGGTTPEGVSVCVAAKKKKDTLTYAAAAGGSLLLLFGLFALGKGGRRGAPAVAGYRSRRRRRR